MKHRVLDQLDHKISRKIPKKKKKKILHPKGTIIVVSMPRLIASIQSLTQTRDPAHFRRIFIYHALLSISPPFRSDDLPLSTFSSPSIDRDHRRSHHTRSTRVSEGKRETENLLTSPATTRENDRTIYARSIDPCVDEAWTRCETYAWYARHGAGRTFVQDGFDARTGDEREPGSNPENRERGHPTERVDERARGQGGGANGRERGRGRRNGASLSPLPGYEIRIRHSSAHQLTSERVSRFRNTNTSPRHSSRVVVPFRMLYAYTYGSVLARFPSRKMNIFF